MALSTTADTAWAVGIEGRGVSDALTQSFVGNVVGQGVGDALSAGLRRGLSGLVAGSPGRICFAAGTLVQLADTTTSSPRFEPIEQLHLGQRVQTDHPTSAGRKEPEPEPATWRTLELVPVDSQDSDVRIRLLRPTEWLTAMNATAGKIISLEIFELNLSGEVQVVAIAPSPAIDSGPGAVITGTFEHTAKQLVQVSVAGLDAPIRCTPRHPFWSVTRQAFVPAEELADGELLLARDGKTSRVISVNAAHHPETVYNIEVHGEHVYRVSTLGLLVHNASEVVAPNSAAANVVDDVATMRTRLSRLGYDDANTARIMNAIENGEQVVIVGEKMKRVRAVARMVERAGGKSVSYVPRKFRSTPGGVDRLDLEANRSWIRYWAKDMGTLVIDIGRQPTVRPDGPSPFYGVENRSLERWKIYTPCSE